jgi:uncharacterized membrane protein YeiH
MSALVSPPLWLELTSIVAGALAGATYGASRRLDAVGTAALAVVGGLGGGVMRDILLGTVPLALAKPSYLYTVLLSALAGMFFGSMVDRLKLLVVILDTIALGLFTIVGASRALLFDLPPISAVMLGLVTGIGGGVVLDVLVGDLPPGAFRRAAPYATAALAGSAAYTILTVLTELPANATAVASVTLVW